MGEDALGVMVDEGTLVGKYRVRRWSLGKIVKLAPVLRLLHRECVEKKITLEALLTNPIDGILTLMPYARDIISCTLEIPVEEADALEGDLALALAATIFHQNLEYVRKLFGPTGILMSTLTTLAKEEEA